MRKNVQQFFARRPGEYLTGAAQDGQRWRICGKNEEYKTRIKEEKLLLKGVKMQD